jgi:DNA-binding GntR family transcriptional regulator
MEQMGPISRGALRNDVVRHLLMAIFQGEMPAGTRLVAKRLADSLGISPTPIREALVELAATGVVQLLHNRGAKVNPFGRQQLRDYFHVRRILEIEAARCVCGRIDAPTIRMLQQEMEDLRTTKSKVDAEWSRRATAADRKLHDTIAANSGNARLAYEIRRYHVLMQCFREIANHGGQFQRQGVEEHLSILEAIAAQSAERAAAAMSRHIESVGSATEAVLFQKDEEGPAA